jgi:heptosyltransferase-3
MEFELTPVILTGPGEEHVGNELIGLMAPFKPLILNIRRLGLLGAVLEHAKIHIGNDNGPKHIAVACRAPTFTIYGPHSHISWTYPDSNRHDYIIPADCDPSCKADNHICGPICINKITLDAVAERFRNFILKLNLVDQTMRSK